MKLFTLSKDGGPLSRVWGYFLFEIKSLASVVLLNFKDGSREAYHNHAFPAISWVLWGQLEEHLIDGTVNVYKPSLWPVITKKNTFHKVISKKNSWVLSLRGSWVNDWYEFEPTGSVHGHTIGNLIALTHGRQTIAKADGVLKEVVAEMFSS